ncbi:amidase [Piscinibacter sakaiensis]|uniref:amidase n=1 Tax=Piscinibacter sakaiensis TaxID=1547922 RepID=UPI003AADE455
MVDRRGFLVHSALLAAAGPAPLLAGQAVPPGDVASLLAALQQGRLDSSDVVDALLARADAIDSAGPRVNAIVERNPLAQAIARAMDHERLQGRMRGPLHGVPILLKDNIDTGDEMLTTAGSLALAVRPAPADATLVRRLRAAGAVLLGKTNLSEWANFRGARSVSGWSARGGQTLNPHVLDRSPSGSSSGSAAAVAAGLAPLAIGTETDGSLVSPASMCGVVAIKPTLGVVSRHGLVPLAHSQDTAGPLATCVADAALLLQAMAGADPADPATTAPAAAVARHRLAGLRLDAGALSGARLGVAREHFGVHPAADALAETALATLRAAGAVLVDPVTVIADTEALGAAEFDRLLHEFKAGLNAYLARRGDSAEVHSLAELIAFNRVHALAEMPWFGQETFEAAQARGGLDSPAYLRANATCKQLAWTHGLGAALRRHRLDAIVAPTTGPAYPIDPVGGDHWVGGSSQPAAVSGAPHITVPMGSAFALPVGLSFYGAPGHDARLLQLAYAYERRAPPRPEPGFLETVARPRGALAR